jgi:hypothetical protein
LFAQQLVRVGVVAQVCVLVGAAAVLQGLLMLQPVILCYTLLSDLVLYVLLLCLQGLAEQTQCCAA